MDDINIEKLKKRIEELEKDRIQIAGKHLHRNEGIQGINNEVNERDVGSIYIPALLAFVVLCIIFISVLFWDWTPSFRF